MTQEFFVIVERDEDGMLVGEVPQLPACCSQGRTLDELMLNMREATLLSLEESDGIEPMEFVGVQKVAI